MYLLTLASLTILKFLFYCEATDLNKEIRIQNCPGNCTCYELLLSSTVFVQCKNIDYDHIPQQQIPNNITDLYFQYNPIQSINFTSLSDKFRNLKFLSLDHNHIKYIHDVGFQGWNDLYRLDLSHNQISWFPWKMLLVLPQLLMLKLNNNNIMQLPENDDVLDIFKGLDSLQIHNNKIRCGCSLNKFASWLRKIENSKSHVFIPKLVELFCDSWFNLIRSTILNYTVSRSECRRFRNITVLVELNNGSTTHDWDNLKTLWNANKTVKGFGVLTDDSFRLDSVNVLISQLHITKGSRVSLKCDLPSNQTSMEIMGLFKSGDLSKDMKSLLRKSKGNNDRTTFNATQNSSYICGVENLSGTAVRIVDINILDDLDSDNDENITSTNRNESFVNKNDIKEKHHRITLPSDNTTNTQKICKSETLKCRPLLVMQIVGGILICIAIIPLIISTIHCIIKSRQLKAYSRHNLNKNLLQE